MTVIAWDGKTLAADRQSTCAGMRSTTAKIRHLPDGDYAACTGGSDVCHMLVEWYKNGAKPSEWPAVQATDDWARLIIASKDGVVFYERHPVAMLVRDKFIAFGSGRDFAMGAMAAGATASEAVDIASRFSTSCGLGVDEVTL